MTLDLRGVLFGQRQHTQVGNDERIHARLGGILNVPGQLGKFLVRGQGVQRQIDLFAAGMGKDAASCSSPTVRLTGAARMPNSGRAQ